MPMLEGKNKYSKGGIPIQTDNDGNLILSSESIIDIDDVDTIAEVVKVTTVGTITNTVGVSGTVTANQGGAPWSVTVSSGNITVSGTVAATQSGTWNIGTIDSITDPIIVNNEDLLPANIYTSGYQTMPGGTTQVEFDELTVSYDSDYLHKPGVLTVGNISAFYPINITVRQVTSVGGSNLRVNTHNFVAPFVEKMRPTSDVWSSCVLYNKTGAVFTDYSDTIADENGYDVDFTINEVDDAIYFGSKAKFNSISVKIVTELVMNGTLVWEFWNGSAWVSPTIIIDNTSDGTNPLTNDSDRYHIVYFEALTNWTPNSPDGASMVNQYWMRLRCSVFNSITTSPTIRTFIIKPIYTSPLSSFHINELFTTASTSTIITVNPNHDVDDSHEIVYVVTLGEI